MRFSLAGQFRNARSKTKTEKIGTVRPTLITLHHDFYLSIDPI